MRKAGTNGMPCLIKTERLCFLRSLMSLSERPWTVFLIVLLFIFIEFSNQSPSVSFLAGVKNIMHLSKDFV